LKPLASASIFAAISDPSGQATSQYYIQVPGAKHPVYGSIQWRGFVAQMKDGSTAFQLLGTVADPVTSNAVGAIVLKGTFENGVSVVKEGHVTGDAYTALSGGEEASDYWASIQSCDLSSAAQIQNAVKNASDTNTLFKLSNAQRQRLQQ
jgi:hypothetical protein